MGIKAPTGVVLYCMKIDFFSTDYGVAKPSCSNESATVAPDTSKALQRVSG